MRERERERIGGKEGFLSSTKDAMLLSLSRKRRTDLRNLNLGYKNRGAELGEGGRGLENVF